MEEVIARAQHGDEDAFAQLWRTYHHLLLRYFRGKQMAEPEDLASAIWIEVATGIHRFQGTEQDFRRWLFTIAARRRIDDIRAAKRRDGRRDQMQPDRHDLVVPSAGDEAERADALDRAIALLQELPADQREAVMLRVIADLDVRNVAEIMNRREGTVRVLVHRGLKRLSEHTAVTEQLSRTMSSS